ncbi:ferrochelatase [Natronoglycomyces albus]|uniref:Coproporphyrin III ferrochelatase n=1 Tax=Natronoglycomyces albus TaxID=2811108 RepID=A0A895XTL4_9ACTN|nr:ferrochelatase [Natronoglycomyces albus]QSB06655.1 ferrochelatase [Natronoglycomyces albus]
MTYDAILLVSFGGPEGPDDVLPFLRNVTRGRGIPDERLSAVAEHYQHFGGVSPMNDWCRRLLAAMREDFSAHGIGLPIYWGNRNWPPMLVDAVSDMHADGVRNAIAIATSAFGSYSSCAQYIEDIGAARAAIGEDAPNIEKVRHFFDHPRFIDSFADKLRTSLAEVAAGQKTRLVFTSHSIPNRMEDTSGPIGGRYSEQHRLASQLVAESAGWEDGWDLVWQSRSGPPTVPWLEPDINDHIADLAAQGYEHVVVCPIGFLSDHIEVLWDLDNEAKETAEKHGVGLTRVPTPDVDQHLVALLRELVLERTQGKPPRRLSGLPTCDPLVEGSCPARGYSSIRR